MPLATFDVFLSYLSPDRASVTEVAERLRRAGVRPWFDVLELPDGQRFQRQLTDAIEASAAFVYFVGATKVDPQSRWSGEEIDFALEHEKRNPGFPIISVILPGAPDPNTTNSVPGFLRNRPWIDLRDGLNDHATFRRLVDALRSRSARVPAPPLSVTLNREPPDVDEQQARSVAAISPLRTNPHLIQGPIANRTFTPLIGAGCSLVGRSQSAAWATIGMRMEHLIDVLGSDSLAGQYVRALAASSPYGVPLSGAFSGDLDASLQDELLIDLQLTLARLGAHLGRLFASLMHVSTTPVWDAVAYRLPIDPDDPSLLEVCRWSVLACVAAHQLRGTREGRDAAVGLGASGMYDRLTELTAHFDHDSHLTRESLGSDDPKLAKVYDEVFSDIGTARIRERADELVGLAVGGNLSLHELEWVADALWHTFRYDQAAYPRADEFSFQVSLFVTGASGRRPEREGAAEAARSRLSSTTIATWFRQYSGNPSDRMRTFYDALARVLAAEFDSGRRASSGGRDARDVTMPLNPFVFSTNYDLEMERALQECAGSPIFHVVTPVYTYLDERSEPEVHWMIGRHTRQSPLESPHWIWLPESDNHKRISIQGPILIKLNGSPLHELPTPEEIGGLEEDDPNFYQIKHALILSETEHLQHIVWQDALPKFCEIVLLQKSRTLVFLGYSIKEWSTRLRMFTQIHRPDKPRVNRGESRMLAINRSHDPFRSAILGSIGVHRLVGNLEEFTRLVDDVLP